MRWIFVLRLSEGNTSVSVRVLRKAKIVFSYYPNVERQISQRQSASGNCECVETERKTNHLDVFLILKRPLQVISRAINGARRLHSNAACLQHYQTLKSAPHCKEYSERIATFI